MQKNIYIVTGGPGFGKTELVNALHDLGYTCSGEFAYDLIKEQQATAGEILPWKNPKIFQQEILMRRISFFNSVKFDEIAFADRGIPDQIAFASYRGFGMPEALVRKSEEYRYAPLVFITPPWPEIFINNSVRTESFQEALVIHQAIVETYKLLDYQLIDLPLVSVKERVDFIRLTILKHQAI